MIRTVIVRNFKCLRDVQVDLQQLTMFVGANGSGKSSILQAIQLLTQSFYGDGQEDRLSLLRGKSRNSVDICEVILDTGACKYRLSSPLNVDAIHDRSDTQHSSDLNGRSFSRRSDDDQWKPWHGLVPKSVLPVRSIMLRLEVSNLIESNPGANNLGMSADGRGMHVALANMALNDPDTWQQLQGNLRRIVKSVKRLRHTMAAPGQPSGLLFDTVSGDSLTAAQVSEGTLLVLGVLTAVYAPDRPDLILLDDLDRGLHPKAQGDLIALLRETLVAKPELQIIATTHSPYLLDCMEPGEVHMTFLDEGSTRCAPLIHHPKFDKWKDEMHPGELWSLFGEDWVANEPIDQTKGVVAGKDA